MSYWLVQWLGAETRRWAQRVMLTIIAMDIITGNTRIHWPVATMIYTIKSTLPGATCWIIHSMLIALSFTAAYVAIKRFGYEKVESFLYTLLATPYYIERAFLNKPAFERHQA